jgi:hypothetical protein
MKYVTDLDAEPIDPELRACIQEAASLPGARVIKRKGRLFLKGKSAIGAGVHRGRKN